MKTLKIHSTLLSILFLTTMLICNSCSKDKDTNPTTDPIKDRLVGSWNVTYFEEGGFDLIGTLYTSEVLKFEANGNATFSKVNFDGSTQIDTYTYTVNETTSEVTYVNGFGVSTTAKATLSNNDNTLDWVSNEPGGIKGTRKATRI